MKTRRWLQVIGLVVAACLLLIKNGKMELFERESNAHKNLLPQDGVVNYFGQVYTGSVADGLMNQLQKNIEWKHDEAVIFGKRIQTKRLVAWYAERPFSYRYSGTKKVALPWTNDLRNIKELVEMHTNERYNSCLLNLYQSGEEGMAWHSDGETELKKDGTIASISFGEARKFSFKHKKTKERVDCWLEHGSLLVMKSTTQSHWLHRLPPTKKVITPRVNLTFRQMKTMV